MLCTLGFAATKLEDNKYCTYVPLVLIIVIKVSHCSDIRPTLWLNQNGRDIIFLIHVFRRCWSTLNTALPWIALSGNHCDWCYIWGNWSDLTFPWLISLDRALNDNIIFHKQLSRKFMTSQHRCVFVYIQYEVYELMESYLLIMLYLHYSEQCANTKWCGFLLSYQMWLH